MASKWIRVRIKKASRPNYWYAGLVGLVVHGLRHPDGKFYDLAKTSPNHRYIGTAIVEDVAPVVRVPKHARPPERFNPFLSCEEVWGGAPKAFYQVTGAFRVPRPGEYFWGLPCGGCQALVLQSGPDPRSTKHQDPAGIDHRRVILRRIR